MRLIDVDKIDRDRFWMDGSVLVMSVEQLDAAPTVDAVPVVHGEWIIRVDDGDLFSHLHCTNCDFYWSNERHAKIFKYCPNCGAKMN